MNFFLLGIKNNSRKYVNLFESKLKKKRNAFYRQLGYFGKLCFILFVDKIQNYNKNI